ncbi:hypothetical protein GCM10023083_20300 [Streptomyces phyllanthi]
MLNPAAADAFQFHKIVWDRFPTLSDATRETQECQTSLRLTVISAWVSMPGINAVVFTHSSVVPNYTQTPTKACPHIREIP